jgi:hypothetical protein
VKTIDSKEESVKEQPNYFKRGKEKVLVMLERLRERRKRRAADNRFCVLINFSVITAIGFVVFRNFVLSDKWPGGGDVLGLISRAYLYAGDSRWLCVWRTYSFGFPEGINSFDFFLLLIYSVFKDPSVTTKALMFLSFLVAGFSMYAFAYHYTHKHLAALSAAFVYILNQWFFSQFTEAHGDILFSYALAPLIFLVLDRALLSGKPKDSVVLAALLAVLVTGFHPECIVIYGVFLLLFIVFYVATPSKLSSLKIRVKRLLKVSLVSGVVCFLISAFTLLPLILSVSPPYYSSEYRYYLEEAEGGSYLRIADAFTLTSIEKWGYGFILSGPEQTSLPDFPTTTVLTIVFLLAYCTVLFRRDRYTYFFVFSAIISIAISMGPHSWFGDIFVWAWFNVPHFAVFRATSRWIMMAVFSDSFFISILVSMLSEHLRKKEQLSDGKISFGGFRSEIQSPRLRTWLLTLTDFYKSLYRMFYYLGVFLLVLILLIGFISCFFFLSRGLQVYSPPKTYLEPYEWMAGNPGNYKIVTVMRSAGEWSETPGAASDFGYSGMWTDLGWGHDIGHDSSFIHGKPVLQNGGWDPFSRAFVDYLRFRLARENLTDDMLKMLGTFDYKYVVIPSYASDNIRGFFLAQSGGQVIYNQSGSLIIENSFDTPQIFAAAQHAVVVGGLETFASLCKIDSFQLNQTPLVFAEQMGTPLLGNPLLLDSQSIIFVNSDVLDFVMLSLKDDSIMINPVEYGMASMNHTKYWVSDQYWRTVGSLVLNREALTTNGKNSVDIPFKVDSDESYDIWIRMGFAPNRGRLSLLVDNRLYGETCPSSSSITGLRWSNVTRLNIQRGDHVLTLVNDGSGFNDIDAIAIVKPSLFQQRFDESVRVMENYAGRLIFVKEAENMEATGWSVLSSSLNGLVLHSEGRGRIISCEGNASASSVEQEDLGAQRAIDGSLNSRWSSFKAVPQWLQVEWGPSQLVAGVHILFEKALARDYAIQTWDGSGWVNQLNVSGNTMQERFHDFPQIVNTTKVRIYVTAATEFGTTSIWEFEIYSPAGDIYATTKIFSPLKGKYMLAARVAVGPDCGTLYVKANTTQFAVPCQDDQAGFEWREIGPLSLDTGEQQLELKIIGKMDLDTLLIYSLKSDESFLPLDSLFDEQGTLPAISYEVINPCKYLVHVDASRPFLLVFSESYHPSWKAYVNGVENSPFITQFMVNGYYIKTQGRFDLTLYFTAQDIADWGLRISAMTISSILIIAVLWSRPLKPIRDSARKKLEKVKTSSRS